MKKCLIVVDYQNDFVCGSLGFPEAAALENRIADKMAAYRREGGDILFTLDTHTADYLQSFEGQHLPIAHCLENTAGHELFGAVGKAKATSDAVFTKATFGSQDLFDHLKKVRYTQIELVGVVTNICVISNAVLAKTAQPETKIIVDAACVASPDGHLNAAACDVMESLQIEVTHRNDRLQKE